ncbi:hypothetical protein ACRALDRAFT_208975 [Sodiomyces alcalophilus JCM 7366]|uniref:uncharacterized protein n=1 Tax=Sodiomyces alcalophilus JCM 7366 TaxID=591952 RepID=UPI0039B4FD3D
MPSIAPQSPLQYLGHSSRRGFGGWEETIAMSGLLDLHPGRACTYYGRCSRMLCAIRPLYSTTSVLPNTMYALYMHFLHPTYKYVNVMAFLLERAGPSEVVVIMLYECQICTWDFVSLQSQGLFTYVLGAYVVEFSKSTKHKRK